MTRSGTPRLEALDLLRGATVAAMIVVNNPGNWNAVFAPLTHAAWHGLTFADLIFPLFIFIMGVALGLRPALGPALDARSVQRIVTRGALLVGLGLLLNIVASWQAPLDARIPGVLQRIGLTYVIAALTARTVSARGQWLCVAGLLAVQTAALRLGGALEPGHNVGVTLDTLVFGRHLLSLTGDPEGLIGLPTSVVTALLGAAAGRLLQPSPGSHGVTPGALRQLAVGSVAAMAAGALLTQVVPLNKALWTASFTLVTAGIAGGCLVLCVPASARAGRVMRPAYWLGTNPLAIYFCSELVSTLLQQPVLTLAGHHAAAKDLLFWDGLVPVTGGTGGPAASLAYAVAYTAVWVVVANVMHRRDIRLRA